MSGTRGEGALSHAGTRAPGRWFVVPVRCPAPRWRLVCFPYAGAGASAYFSWAKHLATREIEVWNVQYPGRENRLAEEPVREFGALIQQLMEALRPLEAVGVPLAFFGHSMGAVLAHEVACQLFREGRALPVALFLSGRNAPSHCSEPRRLHHLPQNELLDALAEYGNMSEAIRNEPELIELLLPAIRADFALLDDYHQGRATRHAPPLPCQLSVFGGAQDPWTEADGLAHWQQFSSGRFRLRTYAGAHFFINEFRHAMWRSIEDDLACP
jgi:medium-chain acyl-[acyl-carrier-protein] hydrolase